MPARTRQKDMTAVVRRMTRRIVGRFHPDKVILFGSHARGTAGRDSDVDLLVVMPVTGSRRETGIAIGVALSDLPFRSTLSSPRLKSSPSGGISPGPSSARRPSKAGFCMKSRPDVLAEAARLWVAKADADLKMASVILRQSDSSLADGACYHAQQCVEKCFKAVLVASGVDFPRVHDLNALARLSPQLLLLLTDDERRRLTQCASVIRYPGTYEPITLREARRLVALARRVRTAVRKALPASAVGRKAR